MPRHSREQSGTGIYHVMLRGVNRQSIFEDDEDYIRFISLLRNLVQRFDDTGRPSPMHDLCILPDGQPYTSAGKGTDGEHQHRRQTGCRVLCLLLQQEVLTKRTLVSRPFQE